MDQDIEYPIDITEQYLRDTARYSHLVRLSKDQERDLVERARDNDSEARELIILSCLAYIIKVASAYFRTLPTHHDEFLDLISIGHLEAIKMLDVALTKRNCFSYLFMRVKFAIRDHCYYHSDLITRPERDFGRAQTISLNRLQHKWNFDRPMPEVQVNEQINHQPLTDALYEALSELTELQRETVIRHYGLFDQPEERLSDIERIHVSDNRHRLGLKNLRKKLAHLI